MAVILNGVLVSRDTAFASPIQKINEVNITDCTINTLKLDTGDKRIIRNADDSLTITDIIANPKNLPLIPNDSWSLNTEFYAPFNGDLEAGPLSFYGKEVDSIAIRRTSNRSNFLKWEDLKIIPNIKTSVDENLNYYFSDKTLESGIIYEYGLQPISKNERGSIHKIDKKGMIYEHCYLVGENGEQLVLMFNTTISSIRRVTKETKVETIGGKYPYISKNANVGYKELSVSGTITQYQDPQEDFAPRAELLVEDEFFPALNTSIEYEGLYKEYGIVEKNNSVIEREFREKVLNFLQDGKPKLFKSPTEGNIIVYVMNVSLTPKRELGRLIADYSCTLVEIDKATLDNLDKLSIQKR